ncbi:MAG TPA: hypothetical protein VH000_04740 [Rhizomicrobium sp.]|jgi:hypothetical protein|nr:hypothetical protein [Rhizomicrobium sp.]HEX4533516.1 hypothetical protein [Rhizomicrobium sp.]
MTSLSKRLAQGLAVSLLLSTTLAAAPASADAPQLLGTFKDWAAYTNGTGSSKVCYALSAPKTTLPAKAKRDPIYFLISNWPGRNAKAEPEIVPGYQYKEGSSVSAAIGADRFTFFTKNDGGQGGAWIQNTADEQRLISTMRNGQEVIVTGTSKRGTLTTDTYSLGGISDALDKASSACGM